MLVSFLCPTSNAASQCQSFISSHSSIAPPLGQYIYFLFFPTVFLLLFLWIVFKDAVHANRGISLIATVAVYIFIIINGMYPVFLFLGELWIVVIFILGFFYVIARRFRGGGGGGKGGGMAMPGGGGKGGVLSTLAGLASGDIRAREKTVKERVEELRKAARNLNNASPGTDASARALDQFRQAEREAEAAIKELEDYNTRFPIPGTKGRNVVDFAKKYRNEIGEIVHKEKGRT